MVGETLKAADWNLAAKLYHLDIALGISRNGLSLRTRPMSNVFFEIFLNRNICCSYAKIKITHHIKMLQNI